MTGALHLEIRPDDGGYVVTVDQDGYPVRLVGRRSSDGREVLVYSVRCQSLSDVGSVVARAVETHVDVDEG
jgi:hypothetical protein